MASINLTQNLACNGILLSDLRLRFAWFETVKPALIANQTLEPTQVAGFNQLFDDTNGTRGAAR